MKSRLPLVLACVCAVLAGGAVAFNFTRGPKPSGSPARESRDSQAALPLLAKPDANGLALERDHAAVFQRAFWRRAAADDRILHAERRDWLDASSGVEKWQWFIAVQPSAAFREWLIKDNPFELVAVAPADAPVELSSPPTWFPSPSELARFARYRNREGRYLVFHDVTTQRLYATDAGGGFAASRK